MTARYAYLSPGDLLDVVKALDEAPAAAPAAAQPVEVAPPWTPRLRKRDRDDAATY